MSLTQKKAPFKERYNEEKRKRTAQQVISQYPDRIPVIVEKDPRSDVPEIPKEKFLVPHNLTVGKFIIEIRSFMTELSPEKAIFIYAKESSHSKGKEILPPTVELMINVYNKCRDPDGFLYVIYSGENTFGDSV
eukprot:TRINITY_DN7720_c0_g1_i1.p1 TRINITY_DN7720_c0_g1~~TRINITY_DN7720_c0_g1_i1.p1  ORF type:complete len:134 (+),score=21.49 TRINITY_DN7720_c0_g1_i1:43-444(+)